MKYYRIQVFSSNDWFKRFHDKYYKECYIYHDAFDSNVYLVPLTDEDLLVLKLIFPGINTHIPPGPYQLEFLQNQLALRREADAARMEGP